MSDKSNQPTIQQQMADLQDQIAWFDGEDFNIEQAIDRFKKAEDLANQIEKRLDSLKNDVTVLKKKFDSE